MVDLPVGQGGLGAGEVAQEAARASGEILRDYFYREPKKWHLKSPGNIVTEADLLSEEAILSRLKKEFPDFGFLSEEAGVGEGKSAYNWVLDPLDGSNNFGFGIPFFSISLALAYQESILLGIIYDPLRQEMFIAEKGRGASLNGKAIRVSSRKDMKTALVAFDMGYVADKGQETLEVAKALRPHIFSFRILGSGALALAYVACGRLDIYMHRRLYPWDIAAARLLVAEAGGLATDWRGQPLTPESTEIVAGPPQTHSQFLRLATGQA